MILIATSTAAILLAVLAAFVLARRRALLRLRRGARIARTSRGPVQYATAGSSTPVLVLHGGVGGWDQGMLLALDLFAGAEVLVVAPSRPGYLDTPAGTGCTPADAADTCAALLDAIDIRKAVVVGISGGGPTALQFALRYPGRTAGLLLVAAITKHHVQPGRTRSSPAGRIIFANALGPVLDFVLWAWLGLSRLATRRFARMLLQTCETGDAAFLRQRVASIVSHPDQVLWMRGLCRSIFPLSGRRVGLANDLAQFAALAESPAEYAQIACPTLVMHGRLDGNVPVEHAQWVADAVPGARLEVVETCGHLLWMSDDAPRLRRLAQQLVTQAATSL
jgi:pimeloyl-ACP methyl ester carboxylesterase